MITRNNYEIWFMDFLDGKLSPKEVLEMQGFLSEHPDLDAELVEMSADIPVLSSTESGLPHLALKKKITGVGNISEANYETFFIAFHEGDLAKREVEELDGFLLLNPTLVSEFDDFKKLRISHDNEFYPAKNILRKSPAIIPIFRYAVAASVVFLLGMVGVRYVDNMVDLQGVAANEVLPGFNFAHIKRQNVDIAQLPQNIHDTYSQKNAFSASKEFIADNVKSQKLVSVQHSGSSTLQTQDFNLMLEPPPAMYKEISIAQKPSNDELTLVQFFGKVLQNGIGENGLSDGLKKEQKITTGDIMDVAAAPFKNAKEPVLVTTEDKTSGKRRVKLNLGIFEADFALR